MQARLLAASSRATALPVRGCTDLPAFHTGLGCRVASCTVRGYHVGVSRGSPSPGTFLLSAARPENGFVLSDAHDLDATPLE
jgi:hypothetical protein